MFKIPNQMYPKFTLATQYQVINLQVTQRWSCDTVIYEALQGEWCETKQEGEMPGKIVKEDFL